MNRRAPKSPPKSSQRPAGKAATRRPSPRWQSVPSATVFLNARAPSVPTTLAISLEEYFAAGALVGLLASQHDEPDHKWVCSWSFKMGRLLAAEALRRRRRKR